MSAVLRAAKVMRVSRAHPGVYARYHRGDPGIFDSIWSGIKGAVGGFIGGGPLGAIAGGIGGLAGGTKGAATGVSTVSRLTNQLVAARPAGMLDTNILSPSINVGNVTRPGAGQMPAMFPDGRGNTTQGGTSADWNDQPGSLQTACQRGYHANKSGYYSQKYGWVPRGSVCVKNRKRNPLNPRAASRAMARLSSAKKAMQGLNRFSIKSGGCGCK